MKLFDIQTDHQNIVNGYLAAEKAILHNDLQEVLENCDFTYTKDSGVQVVYRLRNFINRIQIGHQAPIAVKDYYYRNANVIGRTQGGIISVNTKGIEKKSNLTFIENAAHELGHILGYHHGTNYPPGSKIGWLLGDREDKNQSVPYTIERLVKCFVIERWFDE